MLRRSAADGARAFRPWFVRRRGPRHDAAARADVPMCRCTAFARARGGAGMPVRYAARAAPGQSNGV
ncbi:hypothetical protein DB771_21950 [Burkholderia sp. AU29985]|nr:hypothetical protein XM57_28670 [Burkholderia cepacia]AYZ94818.1 hypothetical protein EGY28_07090 [Burkholderia dolosa]ETP63813.1 hypothetical protein BDSB_22960 [Burkholderia dolosa PC543]PRE54179.1 hypothetical protein C6P87_06660 [Burkholderia sp. AU12872]PUA74959.1 hypothetical protein DB771_21950 [Burkholderia sp. AU29985]